ncbi:putative complex I intermediate-associated 30 [Micractinium conductrix]|uniref:Complex I intermediate-associated 30 n=1 Tax=Micractinium conductrix TaxID=554055 RepID=A0A2P6V893_9CHLO|nr:putative complex I intermediate-associated 30 [Micractinium conductrix]|eukprot:PSC70312.1 putative complex I intermediate-associated 30 [Micractinium conductrix]
MSLLRRLLRSTDEFIERARRGPYGESSRMLFRFVNSEDLALWSTFSDAEVGGKSTAALQPAEEPKGTALFTGSYSTEVGEGAHARLRRSGYAGISSAPKDAPMDLEDFDALVFRVRGDGRQYIASIRCENWLVDERSNDVWQAFLFACKGEWSEVEIPLSRFLLTWKGKVVEEVVELNSKRITTLGISLAGGDQLQPQGQYGLGLDWIAARNTRTHDYDAAAAEAAAGASGAEGEAEAAAREEGSGEGGGKGKNNAESTGSAGGSNAAGSGSSGSGGLVM